MAASHLFEVADHVGDFGLALADLHVTLSVLLGFASAEHAGQDVGSSFVVLAFLVDRL